MSILKIQIPTKREQVSDRVNINLLLDSIKDLKHNVILFDTKNDIKISKQFRTDANKFIEKFKEFCDPLEQEGRTIAKTRSEVKLTLNKIVDDKLAPISEREKIIKTIKAGLFIPSSDFASCSNKLKELLALEDYNWFGFADEALPIIKQSITFLRGEAVIFNKEKEERELRIKEQRLENEEKIKKEAVAEAMSRLESPKIAIKKEEKCFSPTVHSYDLSIEESKSREHKAMVHNNIMDDLGFIIADKDLIKEVIRAVALKKINNLQIIY